ncbi:MAG TPA: dual specificity protein phosphatase family protein [Thermodesulfovibrionales bacterium]|nr:dual specificity protein phosphatase family protein [Thermodesulfovibrionales bacterium]
MPRCRKVFLGVVILLLFPAGYFVFLWEQGNFHQITAGEAYRSAQLSGDEFAYYIKKYHIRSILNLRGENRNERWYEDEIKVSKDYNIMHYDIPLSADREPAEEHVQKLLAIFKTAPRPILIHCKAGSDRSGLVAAMWKVIVDKENKAEAGRQLYIFYGHVPIGGTSAMDNFFQEWKPPAPD